MGLGLKTAAYDTVRRLAFSPAVHMANRWKVLNKLGWTNIGKSYIRDGCLFIGYDITMSNVYLNRQVFIDASAPARIGQNVQIGPRASIITSTHDIGGRRGRGGTSKTKPVTIGDGCWIGAGAMILPGTTIAEGCVIAAGAVVTKDTDPDGLYAGVPAQRIRDLS